MEQRNPEALIQSINWKTLKDQKSTLLKVIEKCDPDLEIDLNGILHLIDSLQDCAVSYLGLDYETVFEFEED